MTEAQKAEALRSIAEREQVATDRGLHATARSWCDLSAAVAARPAGEMVLAANKAEDMERRQ